MSLPLCWVITDGKAGMENQCVAVARRLGLDPVVKRIRLRAPWRQFSPWALRIGNRLSLAAGSDRLDPPYPDLLIATGRHSVAPALAVRDLTRGECLRVQIQNPGISPRYFDLVVVPRHDRLSGPNIVVTHGAPHGVTPEALEAARSRFADRLAALPHPRVAVLLGGDNGVYRFTEVAAAALADCLSTLLRGNHGSLLLTPSRRTGPVIEKIFRQRLAALPGEIWDGSGDNPYLAYLAYADHILATADSVNMVCEAAATGKPVQVIPLDGGSAKFTRFHDAMQAEGITRPFRGALEQWSYGRFDDAGMVAERIADMLAERGFDLLHHRL
jgi:mitochondrial fission protein ELM1